MRALIILVLLTGASPARAEKSERTSTTLAGIGTGASSVLIVSALLINSSDAQINEPLLYAGLGTFIITPSLGHLYSEQWLTIGMGIRAAAGALAVYGISRKQDQPCIVTPNENCPEVTAGGLTLISLAAIAYVGGIAFDVRDADDAARRYNRRHGGATATLTPTPMRHGAGLSLVGSF